MTKAATSPPTTPPAIAPALEPVLPVFEVSLCTSGAGIAADEDRDLVVIRFPGFNEVRELEREIGEVVVVILGVVDDDGDEEVVSGTVIGRVVEVGIEDGIDEELVMVGGGLGGGVTGTGVKLDEIEGGRTIGDEGPHDVDVGVTVDSTRVEVVVKKEVRLYVAPYRIHRTS